MIKTVHRIAQEIIDAIVIIGILSLSFLSIVAFVPVFVGVCGYFASPKEERNIKTIFKTIMSGGKTLMVFSMIETIALTIAVLNISYFEFANGTVSNTILASSWVVLSLSIWTLLFVSPIIVRMNAATKHLLFNAATVFAASGFKSMLIVIFAGLCVYVGLIFPYALGILIYFLCLVNTSVCNRTIDQLKRKGENHYEESI
jgi:hypothetical protein